MCFHLCNTAVGAGKQSLLTAAVRSFDAPLTDAGVLQAKAASKLVASLRPQVRKPLCRIDYACLPMCADKTAYKTLIGRRGGKGDGGESSGGAGCRFDMQNSSVVLSGLEEGCGKPLVYNSIAGVQSLQHAMQQTQYSWVWLKKEPVLLAHAQLQ